MTKKQEKIKEAYGQYWEDFKSYADENGWIRDKDFWGRWPNSGIEWETTDHDNDYYDKRRPKSLSGLKDNNGWIFIESEVDLPDQPGEYYAVKNHSIEAAHYLGKNRWLMSGSPYPRTTEITGITHYQPIVKPKPPIY